MAVSAVGGRVGGCAREEHRTHSPPHPPAPPSRVLWLLFAAKPLASVYAVGALLLAMTVVLAPFAARALHIAVAFAGDGGIGMEPVPPGEAGEDYEPFTKVGVWVVGWWIDGSNGVWLPPTSPHCPPPSSAPGRPVAPPPQEPLHLRRQPGVGG